MIASGQLASGIWSAIEPNLGWITLLVIVGVVLWFPMPGRGPLSSRRDVWRGFRFGARETVLRYAGYRCEAPIFLAWGRCVDEAVEVDHVIPWSRGGPTVVSNGQAICKGHNRAKGATTPPWWYVLGLERRRRRYYPQETEVRVFAYLDSQEQAARQVWARGRSAKRF